MTKAALDGASATQAEDSPEELAARRPRPWVALCVSLVIAGVSAAAGWWAATETLATPDEAVIDDEAPLSVVVDEQTISQSLNVNVEGERPVDRTVRTGAAGVVTSVDVPDDGVVDQGDRLFTVDEQPVIAVSGSTPFYRDLAPGTEGNDVAQLQQLLTDLEHYDGPVDGEFGPATASAVRDWQDDLAEPRTGVIGYGRLVALGELPARVRVDHEVLDIGVALSGGEEAFSLVAGAPEFSITLGPGQRNLIPLDSDVVIPYGDVQWHARMAEAIDTDTGDLRITLQAEGSEPICGDLCDEAIPGGEPVLIPGRVVAVPETTGPVVPVGAIETTPDGVATVRMADGSERDVTVVASSGGIAVVDGVQTGEEILVEAPSADADDPGAGGSDEADGQDGGT